MKSLSRYLLFPTVVTFGLYIVLTYGGFDHALAGFLYRFEGNAWTLRESVLLTQDFHAGGKILSIAAWLVAFALLIRELLRSRELWDTRRILALSQIVISIAVSALAVSVLKGMTHMDCPWDLADFGGSKQYVYLFERDTLNAVHGRCFPAGQASAGYAWVCLYFSALIVGNLRPWRGLLVGVLFGAVLGIAQQFRGAHFLSHDVVTLWVCWSVSTLVYYGLYLRHREPQGQWAAA